MSDRKPTCLFVGRFQPFHRGHMLVVEGMSKLCEKTVIAIGSTNKSDDENPFTFEERRDMIQRALQAVDIIPKHDVTFIDIPDEDSDESWTQTVLDKAGRVDVAWTGNEWTKTCFENAGVEVKEIKEVPGISATEVRTRIKDGGDWESLVPDEIAKSIKLLDGGSRIS